MLKFVENIGITLAKLPIGWVIMLLVVTVIIHNLENKPE